MDSETVHIDFKLPSGWHELDDRRMRQLLRLIAKGYSADEIRTFCLLRWSGTKVIGKVAPRPGGRTEDRPGYGEYMLKKGKIIFRITPVQFAALLTHLDWIGSLPSAPVRLAKIRRRKALAADFEGVPFEKYIIVDNLYQGYLATNNDGLLDRMAEILYGHRMKLKPEERVCVFYWIAALKDFFAKRYTDFLQPAAGSADGDILGGRRQSVEEAMNAQIRALTKGDITKEKEILSLDTWRALTELNAQAREYRELNDRIKSKK